MRRLLALLILVGVLLPATCMRSPPPVKSDTVALRFVPLSLTAPESEKAAGLAPFRLERVWRIESRYRQFGGYSGLVALGDGRLLAMSDSGFMLRFSPPDAPQSRPMGGDVRGLDTDQHKTARDFEALTADPTRKVFWASMEFENAIMRLRPDKKGRLTYDAMVHPEGMAEWGTNSGPESLVRLHDGRFLALREGFDGLFESRRHAGLRFSADPIKAPDAEPFTLVGLDGMRPTDMKQMPDGRVLILFRRVQWPMPPRFAGAIAIGDPSKIRKGKPWEVQQVAAWGFGMPRDNFEGIAIEQGANGRLIVWLISDDNRSTLQQTLLWKLSINPEDLPDGD
jgi:hypothetical protein